MKKIKDLFNLTGKIAIVTGGLGHIGFALTETLLEMGAFVIVTATENELKDKSSLENLNYFKKEYKNISAETIDFLDDESIVRFFSKIKKADILVNNAYFGISKTLEDTGFEDFNRDLNGTVSSVYKMSKLFSKTAKKGGVIINIASMYGVVAPDWRNYAGTKFNSSPSYGAAKAGVIQLTRYLAAYLAKNKIRVNSISPGPFPKKEVISNKKFYDSLKNKTMLSRIGEPEDLKGIIALLSSDASSFITGQNFVVDGGWTSW